MDTQVYAKEGTAGFPECEIISMCAIKHQPGSPQGYGAAGFLMSTSTPRLFQTRYWSCPPSVMTFINRQSEVRFIRLNHLVLVHLAYLSLSLSVTLLHKHVKLIPASPGGNSAFYCEFLDRVCPLPDEILGQKYPWLMELRSKISRPSKTISFLGGSLINSMNSIFKLYFQRPIFT